MTLYELLKKHPELEHMLIEDVFNFSLQETSDGPFIVPTIKEDVSKEWRATLEEVFKIAKKSADKS